MKQPSCEADIQRDEEDGRERKKTQRDREREREEEDGNNGF